MEEANYDNCLFKWRRLITTIVSLSGGGLQLQRSQNISPEQIYKRKFRDYFKLKEWNKNSFESTPCFVELKIKVLQHCREQKFCWLCPNCPKCPNSPKFPHLVTFSVSFPKTRDKSFTESFNKARIGFPKIMEIKKGIESLPQSPIF